MAAAPRELRRATARHRRATWALPAPHVAHASVLAPIEPDELQRIEVYLHAVINGRVERLVREHRLRLPPLEPLQEMPMRGVWMPVPVMFGGFDYWLERGGPSPHFVSESWFRVVDGSGERHEVSPKGLTLVDADFV